MVEMGLDLLRMLQELHPEIWQNVLVINGKIYLEKEINNKSNS